MRSIVLVVVLLLASPSLAWNDKGHMVVGRLAWNQLTEQQRVKVVAVLRKHPHYEEFLAAKRPEGFSEDEWAFMRAGTWSDWIRSHHSAEYHHATWHYINYPIVPPGSAFDPAQFQPPPGQENIVNQLPVCVDKIANGSDEEKAMYLCWLFHLVGDIHQPLHCTAVFSEQFPQGDQGGNLARIRITSSPVNLHSFWDGLLGTGLTAGAIGKDTAEIERLLKEKPELVADDLRDHQTFESWGKEGYELAKRAVYLNGELKPSKASSGRSKDIPTDDVRQAPPEYAPAAGRTAGVQIGKASTRLAGQLGKLFQ